LTFHFRKDYHGLIIVKEVPMDVVRRVQGILLNPKEEWLRIKSEPATVSGLFTSYVLILAAIPAASQFVGRLLFRPQIPFVRVPVWSVGRALSNAVLSYVFSLVTVYVFALIIDALAPNYSSKPNMTNALKLAVYSMTPVWVAGILYIIPALGILALLAGLYGLYVLYLGFEAPMMDTPRERVLSYLVVSVVVIVALFIVVGLILGALYMRRVV
jgi:hypothetical protein